MCVWVAFPHFLMMTGQRRIWPALFNFQLQKKFNVSSMHIVPVNLSPSSENDRHSIRYPQINREFPPPPMVISLHTSTLNSIGCFQSFSHSIPFPICENLYSPCCGTNPVFLHQNRTPYRCIYSISAVYNCITYIFVLFSIS